MHAHGLEVYADVVLNHRSGGQLEDNVYGRFYTDGGGSLYSENGRTYTAFPLTRGSGRIAWTDGDEYFFPNGSNNPDNTGDFYADNQLAGFHRLYTNSFAYDNALHDGAGRTLALGDSLIAWGDWLTREVGFDGYRFDFVKGLHPDYLRRWVDAGAMRGKFHVHELYDGDLGRVRAYLDQLAGSERPPAVFDFNLRFAYRDVLDGGAPVTRWHESGLINQFGVPFDQIVTFVDNHDFDRTNHLGEVAMDDHSPVRNDKMLAYAHMLTHPGLATVWWRDYFQYGLGDEIDRLIRIRKAFASGAYYALTRPDPNVGAPFWPDSNPGNPENSLYVGQRTGDGDGRGVVVAINTHPTEWAEVFVTQQNDAWTGRTLKDLTGHAGGGTTRVFADNRVRLWAPPKSYTVWVPEGYTLADAPPRPAPDAPDYHRVDFANLQFPSTAAASAGQATTVYVRAYVHGRTQAAGAAAGLSAQVGWGAPGTEPSTWTDWVEAPYFGDVGHLDEFAASVAPGPGRYDVASRVRFDGGAWRYGGFSADGGGFWDGAENASGTLTVAAPGLTLADGAGWRFLSVPHAGATVRTLADQNLVQGVPGSYPNAAPVLYTYGTDWSVPAGLDAPLPLGTGLAWYLFDNDFDPDLADPDNSASVALPMTLAASGDVLAADLDVSLHDQGEGWNLIGNPFPGPLDASALETWDGADALASVVGYVWQCVPDESSPVQCVGSYALTSSLGAVPAWHTVFVQAERPGTLTVPAPGAAQARTGPRFEVGFELAAVGGGAVDRAAAVVFGDGFEQGWDRHDLEKLRSMAAPAVQVALGGERDGAAVLLGQRSLPLGGAEIPVYVSSAGAGAEVVLSWPRLSVPDVWRVTLTDRQSGATVDLRTADRVAVTVPETEARSASAPRPQTVTAGDAAEPRFTLRVQTEQAVSTAEDAASETVLLPPYPNPSRGALAVRYHLAEAGPVRLTVLDPLGREVAVLLESTRPAGPSRAELAAGTLAPGVYVVRLDAGGGVYTRQAVVVR